MTTTGDATFTTYSIVSDITQSAAKVRLLQADHEIICLISRSKRYDNM